MQSIQPEILVHRYRTLLIEGVPARRAVLIVEAVICRIQIGTGLRIRTRIVEYLAEDAVGIKNEGSSIAVSVGEVRRHSSYIGVVSCNVACLEGLR